MNGGSKTKQIKYNLYNLSWNSALAHGCPAGPIMVFKYFLTSYTEADNPPKPRDGLGLDHLYTEGLK